MRELITISKIPQDAQQVQDIVDQAQYTLGLAHAQGKSLLLYMMTRVMVGIGILLPEDPKKAMSWWIKAARYNIRSSWYTLPLHCSLKGRKGKQRRNVRF